MDKLVERFKDQAILAHDDSRITELPVRERERSAKQAELFLEAAAALEAAASALKPFADRVDQIERINTELGLGDDSMAAAPIGDLRSARSAYALIEGETK